MIDTDKKSLVEKLDIAIQCKLNNPTTSITILEQKINELIDVLDDIRHRHPRELGCNCWLCHGLFDEEREAS